MIEQLLIYQNEDAKLYAIEKELADSEERKKATGAKKYLDGVEESVNKLDAKAESLLAQYEKMASEEVVIKEFLSEVEKAIAQMKDEGEGAYLNKKLETATNKLKTLTDGIKQILADIQAVTNEYANIKRLTQKAKEQYVEYGTKYNQLKDSKKEEKEASAKELEKLKKAVDPAVMEKYQQKRNNKIFPVIYPVNGSSCGFCGMEFSLVEKNKLKTGELMECSQCGRLNFSK